MGTVMFGAFVSVKVVNLDISGSSRDGNSSSGGGRSRREASKKRRSMVSAEQDNDGPNIVGLLGSVLSNTTQDNDDGLVDVWFERKSTNGKKKAPQRKK